MLSEGLRFLLLGGPVGGVGAFEGGGGDISGGGRGKRWVGVYDLGSGEMLVVKL